ncbi:unnamed protein product, partial [Scytosiphon promiscuus]
YTTVHRRRSRGRSCQTCYERRLRSAKTAASEPTEAASTWVGLGVEERPRLDPAVKLREMVLSAVGRGGVWFWEDVAEWMSDDRRKAGYEVREGKSRRNFVRELFKDIAQSPGSTAR